MKQEKGLGMIAVIILICIIVAVVTGIVIAVKGVKEDNNEKNIKANMLLIQGKCKVIQDNSIMKKNQDDYVGTKLSEFKDIEEIEEEEKTQEEGEEKEGEESQENSEEQSVDNNEENKEEKKKGIIGQFKEVDLLPVSEFDKYYVLTDEDLEKLNLDFKNEKGAYYLVNYETSEVVITKGLKGTFKLSEMTQDEEDNTIEEQNSEEQSNEEQKEEEEKAEETETEEKTEE